MERLSQGSQREDAGCQHWRLHNALEEKKLYRKIKRGKNKISCQDIEEEEKNLEIVQTWKAQIAVVLLVIVSLISSSLKIN